MWKAKRGAVVDTAFFEDSAAAYSVSCVKVRTGASIMNCVDVLPQPSLVLLVLTDLVDLKEDLMAAFAS